VLGPREIRMTGGHRILRPLALTNATPQIGPMADESLFNCSNCNGLYHIVKVEASPVMNEDQLTCLNCGGPLNGREGRFILKYFFIDRRSGKTETPARLRRA
jgi:hypothetical protein